MDPWLPGCPLVAVNEDMPVFYVKNGAHHTDSFLPKPDDDQLGTNVREVQDQIVAQLGKWFKKYSKDLNDPKSAFAQEIKNPTSFV